MRDLDITSFKILIFKSDQSQRIYALLIFKAEESTSNSCKIN